MIVTYNKATVTCFSAGCFNSGKPANVLIGQVNPIVVCGVCGNPITDITVTGTESRDE